MKCKIGDEMHAKSGGTLTSPYSKLRVLDLCMAPGGYATSVLKHSPHAFVCTFTLHHTKGGNKPLLCATTRIRMQYGDITMLYKEFGVEDIPRDHCEFSKFDDRRLWDRIRYDLVFCDGHPLRMHKVADYRRQVEATRLRLSQLILAMQRIESGGTLVVYLTGSAVYETINILHLFDKIAELQLFKSTFKMCRGSFYAIAKNMRPGHPKAVAAVDEWKTVWKELTFPILDANGQAKPPKAANGSERAGQVSDLLKVFGERIIELGEPLWQIQKDALATAQWSTDKEKEEPGNEEIPTEEASTTATDDGAAVAAVRDLGEDGGETADEDGEDDDDVDAVSLQDEGETADEDSEDDDDAGGVSLQGFDSEPAASDPEGQGGVSVALWRMGVED